MLTFSYIAAALIAVAAVVLSFIFITPEKKRAGLNKFGKFLHDTLNFKYLIIEKVLQALYIFATAYVIAYGFFMLFYVQSIPFSSINHWYGGYGLLMMILGPIAVRLIYELLIMTVLLVKNVISINNKLKNQNENANEGDIFSVPDIKSYEGSPKTPAIPVAPAAPVAVPEAPAQAPMAAPEPPPVCPNCGATGEAGAFCTKCGTSLK